MASRTRQKEEARARRLAEERARAERAQRTRRVRMLGGVLLLAVVIVGVAIAISASGGSSSAPKPNSTAARQASGTVNTLLAGIPQKATTLGSPTAPVTVTEFGDLECAHCQDFALNAESQLIANDVKSGKVKLVYRSLATASGANPDKNAFMNQQSAAYAAGAQNKAWNYILLFYHEQGQEGTAYVTQSYLNGLAAQIPGLNLPQWLSQSRSYTGQVSADEQAAAAGGYSSTPTILVQGPKGQAQPIQGVADYGTLESVVKSVE